jgi:hypothetical protein
VLTEQAAEVQHNMSSIDAGKGWTILTSGSSLFMASAAAIAFADGPRRRTLRQSDFLG